jgi:sulfite reductase (NADPH) hemoprotein beta-component
MSHGNEETFPRLADVLGFIPPTRSTPSAKPCSPRSAITATGPIASTPASNTPSRIAASPGSRPRSKSAPASPSQPARPFHFTTIEDPHGWHECADGRWFYGLHILSGRIKDLPGWPMKTALREIAQIHTGDFRLTPSQNLSIAGVTAGAKAAHRRHPRRHGLTEENKRSGLRLNALSCVALPTCGLALAESERVLPDILEKFETVLEEAGLRDDAISLRVTGCPNGCARPYLARSASSARRRTNTRSISARATTAPGSTASSRPASPSTTP